MKKALAILVVLMVLAIPVFAGASPYHPVRETEGALVHNHIDFDATSKTTIEYDFFMFPVVEDGGATVTPEVPVIPAAGAVAATGIAAVMALLGCALIPKK